MKLLLLIFCLACISVTTAQSANRIVVTIGRSSSNLKKASKPSGYTCPRYVSRSNWAGTDTYRDTFRIYNSASSTYLWAKRTDRNGGWGMNLKVYCDKVPSPSYLAWDSSNYYYKVAVRHGVEMKAGTVKDVCKAMGMNHVCLWKDINHRENVKGCVTMVESKESVLIHEISKRVCGDTDVTKCQKLYGVFTEVQNWSYAPCGAMPERHCVARSGFVSGPGSDYSKESTSAQYYGLCSIQSSMVK